jgi:hypothetical protein
MKMHGPSLKNSLPEGQTDPDCIVEFCCIVWFGIGTRVRATSLIYVQYLIIHLFDVQPP